jgi:fatty acid desaturase
VLPPHDRIGRRRGAAWVLLSPRRSDLAGFDRPSASFRRSPASPIARRAAWALPPTDAGWVLRFDWRSAPGEDTLPRAVWGRGAIIAAVLALWIAMAVAWGWAAGMAFAFVVAIPLARMAGVMLGGTLIQQAGRSYYERQLRGRRRAP